MTRPVHPVILSGGAGTRLWPISRQLWPKQFHVFRDGISLFAQTLRRVRSDVFAPPIVVSNDEHRFLVAEELRRECIEDADILLEPVARNTAPAIASAALLAMQRDQNALILVLPSDHYIDDSGAFEAALALAIDKVDEGCLVTFGVTAARPHTGFGYVRQGETLSTDCWKVESFIEKPDVESAKRYVEEGTYLWNTGIFLFKASQILDELERYQSEIVLAARMAVGAKYEDLGFVRLGSDAFQSMPSISIDHAVLEPTEKAAVVKLNTSWNDVGSWSNLWEMGPTDSDGNVTFGDVVVRNSANSYIRSEQSLVAVCGLNDIAVVATGDAVLVVSKDCAEDVKDIVEVLRADRREEAVSHTRVYRPWGNYQNLEGGDGFLVKRIVVDPGAKLSLQLHNHRAEHWIVVQGVARVTNGDEVFNLEASQSTYIPLGAQHRLENPGTEPLHLIEVQTGSYLSEDDIVRLRDSYGRA